MIIFITGATAGFGQCFAKHFITQGHRVIACGRRIERLDSLKAQWGSSLYTMPLDVRDQQAVARCIGNLPPEWREIDVVINNAGLLGIAPAQQASIDDWNKMIDTNIKGVVNITHAILPTMIQRNYGHIINIGSIAGNWPYPGSNVYGASKAFLRQFSLNLRADLQGTALRVTNLEPGLVSGTEFSHVRFKGDEEKAQAVYAGSTPLQAEDIAQVVYWIASLPAHININTLELMPVCQLFCGLVGAENKLAMYNADAISRGLLRRRDRL